MAMGNNPGQLDHVALMVWPEHLEERVEELSRLLGVEFEFFEAPRQGIRGALSSQSQLEFIAPLRDGSGASDSLVRLLEERGEGIHSITFGVADADASDAHLRANGVRTRGVYDAINEDTPAFVREEFSVIRECHLRERLSGALFVLSQIERREGTADQ